MLEFLLKRSTVGTGESHTMVISISKMIEQQYSLDGNVEKDARHPASLSNTSEPGTQFLEPTIIKLFD